MSLVAHLHSSPAAGSQIASSDHSGGPSSLIIIVVVVFAAIWLLSYLGGSQPTVVVVQRHAGSFFGYIIIAIGIAILFFVYIAPGSGQT